MSETEASRAGEYDSMTRYKFLQKTLSDLRGVKSIIDQIAATLETELAIQQKAYSKQRADIERDLDVLFNGPNSQLKSDVFDSSLSPAGTLSSAIVDSVNN